jgi:hypothetical protein
MSKALVLLFLDKFIDVEQLNSEFRLGKKVIFTAQNDFLVPKMELA